MFWLNIFLIVVSLLLSICVLLQQRGSGFSMSLVNNDAVYYTKRGAEKVVFIATIIFGILFIVGACARLFLPLFLR